MKSKLKVFGVVAFAIALCFALVGCGGGDKADPKKAVIGTWELSELTGASEDDMAMMKAFGLTIEARTARSSSVCSARRWTAPGTPSRLIRCP